MTALLDVADQYSQKPASYFANVRHDIVSRLPLAPDARILEIGCGAGGTGAAALLAGKAGHYVGIELSSDAANCAAANLSQVIIGNAETMDMSRFDVPFDALIMSEVVEHLIDPWATVSRLATLIRPGGMVIASSPNISHWQVIRSLTKGQFVYSDSGMMDQTHMRWFTPSSYKALFEGAGFAIESLEPIKAPNRKKRWFNALTGNKFRHLTMTQIMVTGYKRA